MLVIQNICRDIFFLFWLICAPSFIYSDMELQSFDHVKHNNEVMKKGAINQNILRESGLGNQSRVKLRKKHKTLTWKSVV